MPTSVLKLLRGVIIMVYKYLKGVKHQEERGII